MGSVRSLATDVGSTWGAVVGAGAAGASPLPAVSRNANANRRKALASGSGYDVRAWSNGPCPWIFPDAHWDCHLQAKFSAGPWVFATVVPG